MICSDTLLLQVLPSLSALHSFQVCNHLLQAIILSLHVRHYLFSMDTLNTTTQHTYKLFTSPLTIPAIHTSSIHPCTSAHHHAAMRHAHTAHATHSRKPAHISTTSAHRVVPLVSLIIHNLTHHHPASLSLFVLPCVSMPPIYSTSSYFTCRLIMTFTGTTLHHNHMPFLAQDENHHSVSLNQLIMDDTGRYPFSPL